MAIAVYGANGYQGQLVLEELRARGMAPVLVGRNRSRLTSAAAAVGGGEVRVAELDDQKGLVAAFEGADAVINCAGPFTLTGHQVIRAALAAGVPYIDTTGEQEYLKSVFDTFSDEARSAGVSVVPAANDGCVPVDLVADLMSGGIRPSDRIAVTHVIVGGGGPSRGSLRSAVGTMDALVSGGLTYIDGEWRPGVAASLAELVMPGSTEPIKVVRLPLCEVITIPRHVAVSNVESLVDAAVGERLRTPLPPGLLDTLPDGPSADARAGQRFSYVIDVWRGDEIAGRGVVEGVDTYGTTASIAVEAAHRLGRGGTGPGVLAPAEAFSAGDFLDFLGQAGVRWSIGEAPLN